MTNYYTHIFYRELSKEGKVVKVVISDRDGMCIEYRPKDQDCYEKQIYMVYDKQNTLRQEVVSEQAISDDLTRLLVKGEEVSDRLKWLEDNIYEYEEAPGKRSTILLTNRKFKK